MKTGKNVLGRLAVVAAGVLLGWAAVAYVPTAVQTARVEYRKLVVSPRLVNGYLRSHTVRKLQIGTGGNNKRDWLNTDLDPASGQAYLDATRRFPLPDRSFQYVFSEHVIEHLSYEDGMTMLKESYRVLAPGGRVRIATPDLLRFVALFQPSKSEEARRYMDEKLRVHEWPRTNVPEAVILNLQLRSFGHQFVYDPATLRERLAQAGFQQIAQFAAGRSDSPELRDLEGRARTVYQNINDYETMVFEAVRP